VTARPQVRAWRRFVERQAQLEPVTFDAVLADIERRDARDAGRESAPMRAAPDADLLETSDFLSDVRVVRADLALWGIPAIPDRNA